MSIKVKLLTGRTIGQGRAYESYKLGDEMKRAGAIIELDPEDMDELNLITGDKVLVKTDYGEVVVHAVKSPNAPHKGIAFIPMGLWANQVVNFDTTGVGTPTFKGMIATIEPAPDKKVLSPIEIAKSFKS